MSKKDVHRLSAEPGISHILLGISSHENDYRLSWAMNEHLGFKFTRTDNYQSFNPRLNEHQEFSAYYFDDEQYQNTFKLISNRCDNGFLLDELKNIDFLLIIEPSDFSFNVLELMSKIKGIPFISAVFSIEISTLKNRKRLI